MIISLMAGLSVLGGGLLGAATARADGIYPLVNCVSWLPSAGELAVDFGYFNASGDEEFVPVGDSNMVSPGPEDLGQTTFFVTDYVPKAWATSVFGDSPSLTWTVDDGSGANSATANLDSVDCHTPNSAPTPGTGITVVGDPVVGQPLFAATGAWQGDVASYSIQWQVEDPQANWSDLPNGQSLTFTPTSDLVGEHLRFAVTAFSHGDSATATADAPTTVQAAPAPPASALEPSVAGLDFGLQRVGANGPPKVIQFRNTGSTPVTFGGYLKDGADPADFTLRPSTCGTVQPSATCQFTLSFRPTATGPRTALFQVFDSASQASSTVTLTGIGTTHGH